MASKASEVNKGIGRDAKIETLYYVSFQFSDNSRKNLNVDIDTYNTVMENETGVLTFKQDSETLYFISFQTQT